jgi:hypothetical protein
MCVSTSVSLLIFVWTRNVLFFPNKSWLLTKGSLNIWTLCSQQWTMFYDIEAVRQLCYTLHVLSADIYCFVYVLYWSLCYGTGHMHECRYFIPVIHMSTLWMYIQSIYPLPTIDYRDLAMDLVYLHHPLPTLWLFVFGQSFDYIPNMTLEWTRGLWVSFASFSTGYNPYAMCNSPLKAHRDTGRLSGSWLHPMFINQGPFAAGRWDIIKAADYQGSEAAHLH